MSRRSQRGQRAESSSRATGDTVARETDASHRNMVRHSVLRRLRELAIAVVAVALISVVGIWVRAPLPHGCDFHTATQFAGTPERLQARLADRCATLTYADAKTSLLRDFVFAVVYGAVLAALIWWWWKHLKAWRIAKLNGLVAAVWVVPIAAALFDVVENVLTLVALHGGGAGHPPAYTNGWLPLVITTVAYLHWTFVLVAVACAIAALWAQLAPRPHDTNDPLPQYEPATSAGHDRELGVCCSGGGIRSAAYSLGALSVLEARGVLQRARWLAAVSGGNYAATGWTLMRYGTQQGHVAAATQKPAAQLIAWLKKSRHHRYLSWAHGGIARSMLFSLVVITFNLVVATAAVFALAWPAGKLVSSWAVQPELTKVPFPGSVGVPIRLWLPAAAVGALALLLYLARAALPLRGPSPTARSAAICGAIAAVLFVVLVATPVAIVTGHNWLSGGYGGATIAGVSVASAIGAAWRTMRVRITKLAPRLGGVALAIAMIGGGGWIAHDAARGSSTWWWLGWAIPLAVAYMFLPIAWASLRPIYRAGLNYGFARRSEKDSAEAVTWSDLQALEGPELLVCAASQRVGVSRTGIKACSLTISPNYVSYNRNPDAPVVLATRDYLDALPNHTARHLCKVPGWMATSGAAFSSAMGRHNMGSTNALMATFNIDLGTWIPNPAKVADGRRGFTRIRLGYLLKEIFGIYDDNDDNIFAADGGQWENLGLVELLRRQCQDIICIDASGDAAGMFSTLREAIDLALVELDHVTAIEPNFDNLRGIDGAPPASCIGVWDIHYVNTTGKLYYAKAQVAATSPSDVRRFAHEDPTFPRYSTGKQFLSQDQFKYLVAAGQDAAEQLAKRYVDANPPRPAPEPQPATDASAPSPAAVATR